MVAQGYRGYPPYYAAALRSLGHDITTFVGMRQYDLPTRVRRALRVRLPNLVGANRSYAWAEQARLRAFLRRKGERFDLCLFVNAHPLVTDDLLVELRSRGSVSGLWLLDDHEDRDDLSPGSFDHLASFSQRDAIRLKRDTGRSCDYVPQGFAPVPFRPPREPHSVPLILGSPSGGRQEVAAAMVRAGIPVHLVGRTWGDFYRPSRAVRMTGDVSLPRSLTLSAGARVNLTSHRDPTTGVSPRVFEIAAAGGVLLTDNAAALDFYENGAEALHFSDPAQAVHHVRRLLRSPRWAERIARQGRRRTMAEHTLDKRFAALLSAWGWD